MPLLVLGCAALAIHAGTKKVDHWVPRILEDLRSPKPIAAFVLSLLIPGIAQMRQDRFFLGLVLFVVLLTNIAFVLTPVLLGWIGHFYDVSLGAKIAAIFFVSVWALVAATDAWHFARRVHGLAPNFGSHAVSAAEQPHRI